MSQFGDFYARYYDVMYGEKDYVQEVNCVQGWFEKYGQGKIKTILSLGAGTLNHETLFCKKGYIIQGVELSPEMISLANQKIQSEHLLGITLVQGDMRTLHLPTSNYDAVISMFNTVGYCDGIEDLEKVFKNVSSTLKPEGLFIFDAWHAPAVEASPPYNRWKKWKKEGGELYRLTSQVINTQARYIDLTVELIEISQNHLSGRATENHRVHYWYLDEIKKIGEKYHLEVIDSCVFPFPDRPISGEEWSMGIVLKKV